MQVFWKSLSHSEIKASKLLLRQRVGLPDTHGCSSDTHGCSFEGKAFPRERFLNRNHSYRYSRHLTIIKCLSMIRPRPGRVDHPGNQPARPIAGPTSGPRPAVAIQGHPGESERLLPGACSEHRTQSTASRIARRRAGVSHILPGLMHVTRPDPAPGTGINQKRQIAVELLNTTQLGSNTSNNCLPQFQTEVYSSTEV